jgi:homoserine dehydrogenase
MTKKKNIGLVGFGVVGQGVYKLLRAQTDPQFHIKTIVVKNKNKHRILPEERFSYEIDEVLNDPSIDVIVEVTNDENAAFELVRSALLKGLNVISGNKKMLANHLPKLEEAAQMGNAKLRYEAAVGGTIPVLSTVDTYLKDEEITGIRAVLNGTSNFILTSIKNGNTYAQALREAQLNGFAEADPTMDVGGYDAKFKLSLLLHRATGVYVPPTQILNAGISSISAKDVNWGEAFGYTLKPLVSWSKLTEKDVLYSLPVFVSAHDSLNSVSGVLNGVELYTKHSGEYRLTGEGAGEKPTAHAIIADLNYLEQNQGYSNKGKMNNLNVGADVELPVYIRSSGTEVTSLLSGWPAAETIQSGNDHTWIGDVSLHELLSLPKSAKKQLFIAVLPENHLSKCYRSNEREAIFN